MASHAVEEAVHVVEVLDHLAGEHRVEPPPEVEILRVGQLDGVTLRLRVS